jgi:LemA protein
VIADLGFDAGDACAALDHAIGVRLRQQGLSSALSHLLVVTENYPDLKATANFRDLQAQLEGTENRITVERQRFNEAAQAFNTRRKQFSNSADRRVFRR